MDQMDQMDVQRVWDWKYCARSQIQWNTIGFYCSNRTILATTVADRGVRDLATVHWLTLLLTDSIKLHVDQNNTNPT